MFGQRYRGGYVRNVAGGLDSIFGVRQEGRGPNSGGKRAAVVKMGRVWCVIEELRRLAAGFVHPLLDVKGFMIRRQGMPYGFECGCVSEAFLFEWV